MRRVKRVNLVQKVTAHVPEAMALLPQRLDPKVTKEKRVIKGFQAQLDRKVNPVMTVPMVFPELLA